MTALYIIGGILLFILLLCLIPVGIRIVYDKEFALSVTIGPVRKQIIPKKEKKIRISDYSYEKLERRKRREEKKAAAKAKKKKKNEKKGSAGKEEKKDSVLVSKLKNPDTAPEMIEQLYDMLSVIVEKFARRLHIKFFTLDATIGSDNAAKTAILYGGACSAAGMIASLLSQYTDAKNKKNGIRIAPDFLAEKTAVSADVSAKIYVGGVFTYLFEIRKIIKQLLNLLQEDTSNG
ncbi:MAG: DUF2953 domain-containing protein [Clostridia bacterium]|nr:DUF2953 domain-containing protein [Clostridia bacterium]